MDHAAIALYLDLLKGCLSRALFFDEEVWPILGRRHFAARLFGGPLVLDVLRHSGVELVRRAPSVTTPAIRAEGKDRPPHAETMIGMKRLDNLQSCLSDVLKQGVRGDLIETGVWRGGAAIFMRAVLKAHGVTDRIVWACDSFEGLPKPDETTYPADRGDILWTETEFAVSLEQVQRNFARYGLLDNQVRFVKGWFSDTLNTIDAERFAVIRLDGDMYSSTTQSLMALYPKLSVGGYCIVDDYNNIAACRQAVTDYRATHGIDEKIESIDWGGVYWQRLR